MHVHACTHAHTHKWQIWYAHLRLLLLLLNKTKSHRNKLSFWQPFLLCARLGAKPCTTVPYWHLSTVFLVGNSEFYVSYAQRHNTAMNGSIEISPIIRNLKKAYVLQCLSTSCTETWGCEWPSYGETALHKQVHELLVKRDGGRRSIPFSPTLLPLSFSPFPLSCPWTPTYNYVQAEAQITKSSLGEGADEPYKRSGWIKQLGRGTINTPHTCWIIKGWREPHCPSPNWICCMCISTQFWNVCWFWGLRRERISSMEPLRTFTSYALRSASDKLWNQQIWTLIEDL